MTTDVITQRPNCPECQTPMGKRDKRWSGRHKKQLWICSKCGRTKLTPLFKENKTAYTVSKPAKSPRIPSVKLEIKPEPAKPTPTTKYLRLCDGNYVLGNVKRRCKLSENGYCIKVYFPLSCLKYKRREEWEALPTN